MNQRILLFTVLLLLLNGCGLDDVFEMEEQCCCVATDYSSGSAAEYRNAKECRASNSHSCTSEAAGHCASTSFSNPGDNELGFASYNDVRQLLVNISYTNDLDFENPKSTPPSSFHLKNSHQCSSICDPENELAKNYCLYGQVGKLSSPVNELSFSKNSYNALIKTPVLDLSKDNIMSTFSQKHDPCDYHLQTTDNDISVQGKKCTARISMAGNGKIRISMSDSINATISKLKGARRISDIEGISLSFDKESINSVFGGKITDIELKKNYAYLKTQSCIEIRIQ